MTRRAFDRFMVDGELGSNPKIARFTNAEFRCLLTGVWPLAAKADPRGCLVVAGQPATELDIAHQAHCSAAVARSTLAKMRELRMLDRDGGLERCHDWDDINPAPKVDATAAERKRRQRERKNQDGHAVVTRDSHDVTPGEVEVEVEGEVEDSPAVSGARRRSTRKQADVTQLCTGLPPELELRVDEVLPLLLEVHSQRGGTEPNRLGVSQIIKAYPSLDHATIAQEFAAYWTSGPGHAIPITDWHRTFRNRCKSVPASTPITPGDEIAARLQRANRRERLHPAIRRRNAWEDGYDEEGSAA